MPATNAAQHTPGPWWQGSTLDDSVFAAGGGDEVCVAVCPERSVISDGAETYANARLIAAAPDLLEALKAVVAVADRKTVEFERARAAIAKAEGR